MTRRLRREDPAYLAAMREAKAMFEAEMAKSAMKGRGRPKTVVVAAVAAPAADDDVIDLIEEHVEPHADEPGDEADYTGEHAVADAEEHDADAAADVRPRKVPGAPARKAAAPAKGAKAKPAPAAKATKSAGTKSASRSAKAGKDQKAAARKR